MSAAAEVDLEAPVKTFLTTAFNNACYGTGWGAKLAIAFSIGGKTFHTTLQIGRRMLKYPPPRYTGDKEKGVPRLFFYTFVGQSDDEENQHKPSSCIYFETNCVGAPALLVPTSQIHADDTVKKCFDPPLTKETIPGGFTQTDILQVFLTKLKLLQANDAFLLDAAKINITVGNDLTYLSVWRLLKGMKGVYEKYGYVSQIFTEKFIDKMYHQKDERRALIGKGAIGPERAFDVVRRLVTTKPLEEFREFYHYYEITATFEWHYPDVYTKAGGRPTYEGKTIAELISDIPYYRTWFTMRWGETNINIFEVLFMFVLGTPFESVGKLKLDKE
jgi:hypothetical protein